MVFYKSLTRELTLTAIGVFVVLLAILVSTQAINLLGRAAEGQISNDAVAALIGFWALGLFPVPLILTVFVSVMKTLAQCHSGQTQLTTHPDIVTDTGLMTAQPCTRWRLPHNGD